MVTLKYIKEHSKVSQIPYTYGTYEVYIQTDYSIYVSDGSSLFLLEYYLDTNEWDLGGYGGYDASCEAGFIQTFLTEDHYCNCELTKLMDLLNDLCMLFHSRNF